jgi:SAM-dependent methyltransferase
VTTYDEVPYLSFPVEWTAPERLALASLLHGGPRPPVDEYRMLELGCNDGTNLIPLAYYRPQATFVGIDGAVTRIETANQKRSSLSLANISFLVADFTSAVDQVSESFDYIVAHGVFSWVSDENRDALLKLCAERLQPDGLLYLNYNSRPGWNVRGLVRDFLLAQTAGTTGLAARSEKARKIAATIAEELRGAEHPYLSLLGNEFRFVTDNDASHTAHEYLADHNNAYSRREFFELTGRYDLEHVADADYNYVSGRVPEELFQTLARLGLDSDTFDDAADLLRYRQLHSPILAKSGFVRRAPQLTELSRLFAASCLTERETDAAGTTFFDHPCGNEVVVKSESIAAALRLLSAHWPRGYRLDELFPDVTEVIDDLKLLHRNGMIALRVVEPLDAPQPERLYELERRSGYATTAYHGVSTSAGAAVD